MNRNDQLRILILTYQGDMAGSTNSISYLAVKLADRGHLVAVGCRKESLLYSLLENSQVIRIPMQFSSRLDRKNMRQIADAVKKYKIQIINAQSGKDRYTSVFSRFFFRLPVKVVHTRRQISASIGGFLQNLVYYRGTDKVVAVSQGVKQSLIGQGIPDDHIEVIYNGTPVEKYGNLDQGVIEKIREQYQLSADDCVLGCVSRKKRQEQILLALCEVDFPVIAIFVGIEKQDKYLHLLDRLPERHKVYFAGMVPTHQVLNYYKIFSCMVLSSLQEGLSQSLLEAMALEVPVIATHAGGNPELIRDGVNGFIFTDGQAGELAEKISTIKKNQKTREKFVKEGRKTALEDFSIDRTIEKYERFFNSLLMKYDKYSER